MTDVLDPAGVSPVREVNESIIVLLLACQIPDNDDHSDVRVDLRRLAMGTSSASDGL